MLVHDSVCFCFLPQETLCNTQGYEQQGASYYGGSRRAHQPWPVWEATTATMTQRLRICTANTKLSSVVSNDFVCGTHRSKGDLWFRFCSTRTGSCCCFRPFLLSSSTVGRPVDVFARFQRLHVCARAIRRLVLHRLATNQQPCLIQLFVGFPLLRPLLLHMLRFTFTVFPFCLLHLFTSCILI